MRVLFIVAVLVLLAGTLVGELIVQDPGYVLINYRQTTVETSIWGLALITIVGFLLLHFGLRLLSYLAGRRGKLVRWNRNRGRDRANRNTERGLIALAAGEWSKAQRLLSGAADKSDLALVNYLGAAEAAQELNHPETSDELLQAALRTHPKAEVAIGLAQAQNHISRHQLENALALLMRLRRKSPRHTKVLRLLVETYQRLQDWGSLADLLPDVRRYRALPENQLEALERTTHLSRLESALSKLDEGSSSADKALALSQVWNALPKHLSSDATLGARYAALLCEAGATEQAEKLLRAQLKKQWSPELVQLLGKLPTGDSQRQLKQAKSWLDNHPDDATLLLTLGRLAMRNRDWELARGYFEKSLAQQPSQEAFNELSRLLVHLEDVEGYQRLVAENVDHLARELPPLPLPLRESAPAPESDPTAKAETQESERGA
ncbi:heme biosynthesis HemY N-terminal domain-containing protein [Motiliproteus sediminis]|uniref:heme biosynthesis HemY N-terminal domain-containing protein n=1 Tax=Motiliproteus sediminis TaxID=1468178 RepID=UPI001AF00213|nr:heme biosynthesis HemY N-terminal domain-containing protein [Motiliproteus sediminis]